MRSRPSRRALAALALVSALALSGCDAHPGAAVVVNGSAISQSRVDDLVLAACQYQKVNRVKEGGKTPLTSMAYLRLIVLQNLINFRFSQEAVDQLHLSVSPGKVALAARQQTLPPALTGTDRSLMQQFFTASTRSQIEQAVIGAHLKDSSVTNADHVTPQDVQAAQAWLKRFSQRQHVVVNPAYGAWNGRTVVDATGSVSAPASSAAKRWLNLRSQDANSVTGLPPGQVCG